MHDRGTAHSGHAKHGWPKAHQPSILHAGTDKTTSIPNYDLHVHRSHGVLRILDNPVVLRATLL